MQNVVVLVMLLVQWCVPDMPGYLKDKIRREAFITSEIIIKQETERARRAGLTPTLRRKSKCMGDGSVLVPEGAVETLIARYNCCFFQILIIGSARISLYFGTLRDEDKLFLPNPVY